MWPDVLVVDCRPRECVVVLFKKYTAEEYIKEFLTELFVKWGKILTHITIIPVSASFMREGIPVAMCITGKNITAMKRDLRLNPRILRVQNIEIARA